LPRTVPLSDGRMAMEGTWVCYREYAKNETLFVHHAAAIKSAEKWGTDYNIFGPIVADHDAQGVAELREYGVYTTPADKGEGSVERGIYALQKLMMGGTDLVAPRLLVFDTCQGLVDEWQSYKYDPGTDKRDSKEVPVKKNDHRGDSARYA